MSLLTSATYERVAARSGGFPHSALRIGSEPPDVGSDLVVNWDHEHIGTDMRPAGTSQPTQERGLAVFPSGERLMARSGLLRHSRWDALLVWLAAGHGALLLTAPPFWIVASALWWNANTISHNFIHLPFFKTRSLNILFSAYLSVVLGFPQSLWGERHLAHHREALNSRRHGNVSWRLRPSAGWMLEALLVCGWWLSLLSMRPDYFMGNYLPGLLAGLALCQIQGHFEHVRGTLSHYSRLYNWLFFNDGFHVEHHTQPGRHWTQLPRLKVAVDAIQRSRWPAVLRWMDWFSLDGLERLVCRSPALQRFVLQRHEAALRRLPTVSALLPSLRRITIVGGGLFPRTALVLHKLAPQAGLRIVDASAEHLAQAGRWLPKQAELICQFYDVSAAGCLQDSDLLVVPLAFVGDKSAIYRAPPVRHVLVHDWLWRKRGENVVISVLLLKRLNLVRA
ncbi:MAG TPA: fatty acid desaturase [Candidatus Dormibacteraeota bacterium]|nr:fatty acid desaturase [Candidatus Dormibacteraeota bacterium]